jgi:hypothetical protein
MRVVEEKIYLFHELDEGAKETARNWFKDGMEYPWFEDGIKSIRGFCDHFNIGIKDYEVGAFCHSWMTTSAEGQHFRGLKLKNFDPDKMQQGYYLDFDLWREFYEVWKDSSDPLKAFNSAIDGAIRSIQQDWEYQYTDESVDENITINDYEFTEDGKRY